MSKKQLISIIYIGASIIGSFAEFLLNGHKAPVIFNWCIIIPSLITVVFSSFISKPFMKWLDSPLRQNITIDIYDPGEVEYKQKLKNIKLQLANLLLNFGWSNKRNKNTKLLYWKEKDLWLVLWLKRYIMYTLDSEKHKLCGLIDGLEKGIFNIEEIEEFIRGFEVNK